MDDHLGYDRYSRSDTNNARNGSYSKNLITDNGVIELEVPRDRNGDFEPAIVTKKQNRAAGLDKKILSLYAKGMSLADIKQQLYELYEADISESLISKITDGVMDEVMGLAEQAFRMFISDSIF
jgi:transposase-like protein